MAAETIDWSKCSLIEVKPGVQGGALGTTRYAVACQRNRRQLRLRRERGRDFGTVRRRAGSRRGCSGLC